MRDVVGETSSMKRLLLADDDAEIRKLLSRRLIESGYEVFVASDGREAIDMALAELPELVVLDVMMPEKSGWEVARTLRQNAGTAGAKILMLTAIGAGINENMSPIYGADAFLDKPFDFARFEAKIVELIGKP